MRIDKYLWCVRLFKTRSLATVNVDSDRVKINDQFVKRGREVKIGDSFEVKVNPIWRSYKVLDIPKSRIGAKLVDDFMVETTPQPLLDELEALRQVNRSNHNMGLKGRPTKKDRRDIDRLKG